MAGVVIKKCGCKPEPSYAAEYQNKKYGDGMRVCNVDLKKTEAACTVCGRNHKV